MKIKASGSWHGREVDVLEMACVARPCLWVAENKGTFTQGRGYTSYHKHPWLECWTRHLRGCPSPIPDPDPERVRCCPAPNFPRLGKNGRQQPTWQRCRLCGERASGVVLELRRGLPGLPHVNCEHKRVKRSVVWNSIWVCPDCGLGWRSVDRPSPWAAGDPREELMDQELAELKKRLGPES